jgi:AraC-like DNA-binding protein
MNTTLDPLMATANLAVLSDMLIEQGFSAKEIFAATELDETFLSSPYNPAKYSDFLKLVDRALHITKNPRLGLDFGRRLGFSGQGMIGLARISSRTLEDFLEFSAKAMTVTQPSVAMDMVKDNNTGRLRIEFAEVLSWGAARQFCVDYLSSSMAQNIKIFAPDTAHLVTYNLTSAADPDPAFYKHYFSSELVNFDQDFFSIEFPSSMVETPLSLSNPLAVRQGEELVQKMMSAFNAGFDPFILRVRLVIIKNKSRTPNAARVADKLGISVRTLHRRLAEHGTSFRKLAVECQLHIAVSLLERENCPVAKIAKRLGYSQISNFNVAFKQWTGMTVTEYRQQTAKKLRSGLSRRRLIELRL